MFPGPEVQVPSKTKAPKKKTAEAKPAPKKPAQATGKSTNTKPAPKAKDDKRGVMPQGSKSKHKATA
jgi:hypothetical protein